MCKKLKFSVLTSLIALMILMFPVVVDAKGSPKASSYKDITISITADEVKGEVNITGRNASGREMKLLVKKDSSDDQGLWYDVKYGTEINETISLINGAGLYNIYAMINSDINRYSYGPSLQVNNTEKTEITEEPIDVVKPAEPVKKDNVYLGASRHIDVDNPQIIQLSKELTAGAKTDRAKIEAVYTWIVKNITYDFDKYSNMLAKDFSGNFGSISVLESKKGVCYDYSTLFAALCRAAGIETKVAKGYSTNIIGYHAWNEVFDAQKNEWITLDTTVDSAVYHRTNGKVELNIRTQNEYYKTEEM